MNTFVIILILIPISLAISKLISDFKGLGISVKYINVILVIAMLGIEVVMFYLGVSPYLKFVFGGIVIISMIQYILMWKKREKRESSLNWLEKIMYAFQILAGIAILFIPRIINCVGAFEQMESFARYLCYGSYMCLGATYILGGAVYILRYHE